MKLLYKNLLQSASLSSLNADDSTNVKNILDRLLELKYLSTQPTDTITGSWAMDQTISCIAIGYHNLTSATYALKNSGGATVGSGSLEVAYDTNMTYFVSVPFVRSIEITITSVLGAYVGGVSCGVPLSMEYHNVNPRFDYNLNDSATWLIGGQTYGTRTKLTEGWSATLSTMDNPIRQDFQTLLALVGNWFPLYADLYNDNHSEQRPIYGIMQGNGQFTRESITRQYSTNILVQEAR